MLQRITKTIGIAASAALFAALCAPAHADAPAGDDATVTVTANRTPSPIDQVANSVTVITAKDIEQSHQTFVVDVLRDVPGLFVTQTGGPGGLAEVYVRGAGPDKVLVELDGVPLNDPISPQGSYDQLGNLTVDNIERIEVLRGPQSMLYGSKAIAGVISIITKRGHGKPATRFSLNGGSFGTANGSVSIGGSTNGWQYTAAASRYYTDGISFNDLSPTPRMNNPYDNTTLSTNIGRTLNPNLSLNFIARYEHGNTKIAGFDANFLAIDSTSTQKTEEKTFRIGADWHPQKGRLSSTFGLSSNATQYVYDFQVPPGSPPDHEPFNGLSYQADWQANYAASKSHQVTVGAQWLQDQGDFSSAFDSLTRKTLQTTGFFAQDQVTLSPMWHATLGIRNDNHESFGDKTTYRIGSTYQLNSAGTLLRGTFGTGFKAPVVYELYDQLYGNPSLKAEISESWDAGVEQPIMHGTGAVSATYFHTRFTNLIDFVTIDPVAFTGMYENVAGATMKGVELAATLKPTTGVRVKLSYTNLDAVDGNGVSLNRRPRHVYTLATTYHASAKLDLDVNGTAVSDRLDRSAYPTAKLSPYFLVNAAGSYKLTTKTSLTFRVDNVLNQHYEEAYSYRTAGIGGYIGVTVGM